MQKNHPRVGIGVLVFKENRVLLGERIHSHGSGTWSPPGGHLEFGETPLQCAARELNEETSLAAQKVVLGPWTNDFFEKENKHYVTLYMIVPDFIGSPSVQEPDKCLRWKWFDTNDLPQPLFLSFSNLIQENPLEKLVSHFVPLSL